MAPRDVAVNQRLAVLYGRGERYADAARVCQVLSDVYPELGHDKDAARYQEAPRKYALRAPAPAPSMAARAPVPHAPVAPPPPMPTPVPPPTPTHPIPPDTAPSVHQFTYHV